MKFLRRYGRLTAVASAALGLLSTISAFTLFSRPTTAEVWAAGADAPHTIAVDNLIAANWLLRAGIPLYPGDGIQYMGVRISPSLLLPNEDRNKIIYQPAFPVLVGLNGGQAKFFSSAGTLGEALYQNGYHISVGDRVSLTLDTPLNQPLTVEIEKARPLIIEVDGDEITALSAGSTVAEALADAGASLQDQDYTEPAETQPVPEDRRIRIVRVREETVLEEKTIAFTEERIPDPEIAIGEQKILQSGQNGARTEKVRIRYENGEEISRTVEAEWVSKEPVSQKVAVGSKIVIQSSNQNECYVDYWLAKEVEIHSYHDTGNKTSSGVWPYKGVIAVSPEWYSILKGVNICVPGYGVGTVLDKCGACIGNDLIDVFYPIEEYIPWNKILTIYFMPPVPDGFSGDLP